MKKNPFENVHKYFYVLAILDLVIGLLAAFVFFFVAVGDLDENWWAFIVMGGGFFAALISPLVYSWGQLIEDVHLISQKSGTKADSNKDDFLEI